MQIIFTYHMMQEFEYLHRHFVGISKSECKNLRVHPTPSTPLCFQDDVLEPIEFNLYKKARDDETCRRDV